MKHITHSEKETFVCARKLASRLQQGGIIGLVGDLGAGKTAFTKGLAAGLGIRQRITSPTFVLMKVYKIRASASPIREFVHIDAYRIKNIADLLAVGLGDYLDDPTGLVVIEWADKIKPDLPKTAVYIHLKRIADTAREIRLAGRLATPKKRPPARQPRS
jgi:tRNA threonylcarbamoyladenosine biosynthesis protein TsaE